MDMNPISHAPSSPLSPATPSFKGVDVSHYATPLEESTGAVRDLALSYARTYAEREQLEEPGELHRV